MKRVILSLIIVLLLGHSIRAEEKIDRRALVERHHIQSNRTRLLVPVGNGELCFNVDGTGMQTFAGTTLSHWGWHETPLPAKYKPSDVPPAGTMQKGRNKGLDIFPKDKEDLRLWLRRNPHRANIARVRLTHSGGRPIAKEEITGQKRDMDLWTGIHTAQYNLDGVPVRVITCIDDLDTISISVDSEAALKKDLEIALDFSLPNGSTGRWVHEKTKGQKEIYWDFEGGDGDFNAIDQHQTAIAKKLSTGREVTAMTLARKVDQWQYQAGIFCRNAFIRQGSNQHEFRIIPKGKSFEVSFRFAPELVEEPLEKISVARTKEESMARWKNFWLTGGAIDLSGSTDPRWKELERRIVLSQFLMRTSSAGSYPCSESGLLAIDQWQGRFHMEMVWWHLAHYFLWQREALADKALGCYSKFRDNAKIYATQLGYKGYQWQKEVAPDGRTAPWVGSNILLWKEPHPFFFAELEYRARPTRATLEKWADILNGTAEYLADYPTKDAHGIYHLDPVMPPSELGSTSDTIFDLAYWRFGLRQANIWRQRLGLKKNENWKEIMTHMAPLPKNKDGLYVHSAPWQDTYVVRNWEHPDPVGILGMLPPVDGVDPQTARKSVKKVFETWQWNRCWGWDFPWTAMAAARTGQPEMAVDILLKDSPRNCYDQRGVNSGGPCPYLPGNGGILYAVAMMAAGWDGAPNEKAPGFPKDRWNVRFENLRKAP